MLRPATTSAAKATAFDPAIESYFKAHLTLVIILGARAYFWVMSSCTSGTIPKLLASGEGWHNNHHADPASARHGHHWWEIDFTWWMIRILMRLGLAANVSLPSPNLGAQFAQCSTRFPAPNIQR